MDDFGKVAIGMIVVNVVLTAGAIAGVAYAVVWVARQLGH